MEAWKNGWMRMFLSDHILYASKGVQLVSLHGMLACTGEAAAAAFHEEDENAYVKRWVGSMERRYQVPEDISMRGVIYRAGDLPTLHCIRDHRNVSCKIKCSSFENVDHCKSMAIDMITRTLGAVLPRADEDPKLFQLIQEKDFVDQDNNWQLMNNNHFVFLSDHFLVWHDKMVLTRQGGYTWLVESSLTYLAYTHFNQDFSVTMARTLDSSVRGSWQEQKTADPADGKEPATVEDVIAHIKERCRKQQQPSSEVD